MTAKAGDWVRLTDGRAGYVRSVTTAGKIGLMIEFKDGGDAVFVLKTQLSCIENPNTFQAIPYRAPHIGKRERAVGPAGYEHGDR